MSSSVDWRFTEDLSRFEEPFKEKFADVLKEISKTYRFGEYKIEVSTSWELEGRRPDITVFIEDQPFLIIECKRALEYSPFDDFPIGQAYTYALLAKNKGYRVDFVATANQYCMFILKVPDDLEKYANWDAIKRREYNRAFRRELYLKVRTELYVDTLGYELLPSKEKLYEILNKIIKERKKVKAEPFSEGVIKTLKSFVNFIHAFSKQYISYIIRNKLNKEFESLKKRRGVSLSPEQISKEFAYSLMNRILFYKALERYWKLEKLEPLYGKELNGEKIDNGEKYFKALKSFFRKAVEVTKDFEPVFILEFHDKLSLPSYIAVLNAIDGLIKYLDNVEVERLGDVIGYVYEELIDPEERHQFGRFYTPHGVAELIVKWCIRNESDKVLDAGCGSGTFLIEAYKRLYELKTGKKLEGLPERDIHEQIIKQLYGIDIDEFACHLTAINLSMKNIINPSRDLNIIVSDFFLRLPEQQVLLPYEIVTAEGVERRKIEIPKFDCVIGNPPYTRWTEIPENTRNYIRESIGALMSRYELTPQVTRGLEPPIYVFWIMHAEKFLKENGRLGMIISNLWLQTDYGVKFARYLLDRFKIHAIIDIPLRIFEALITTTIILLEKCSDEKDRMNNEVVFVRLPSEVRDIEVDEILRAIKEKRHDKLHVYVYKQSELSRNDKWIKYLFGIAKVERSDKMIELGELFEVSYGNVTYLYLASKGEVRGPRNLGSKEFFYFKPSKAKDWDIPKEYLYPAITSSRYMKWFTFKKEDWEYLKYEDKDCYFFICHKPRNDLPDSVKNYIKWGETECTHGIRRSRTRGRVRTANQAEASQAREEYPQYFYGWYDLGGVKPAKILAVYQAWYKTRFVLCEFPVATYHAILCFIPKIELKKDQLKALLAYLNSSFAQFYVETEGRRSGGGIIALEISQAERMPVLDPRKLSKEEIDKLAKLFDKLEAKARAIGGASEREQIERLKPIIYEIDKEIGKILGLSEFEVYEIERSVEQLIERRIAGAGGVRRSAIRGEEVETNEERENNNQATLDEWL